MFNRLYGLLLFFLCALPVAAQTRTDRYGDPLPDGVLTRLGTVRFRHAENIRAIAFSRDGKILASAGHDQVIRLWHPSTGQPLKVLTGHNGIIVALCFSPDSKLLASASWHGFGNTVRIWNPLTGRELQCFQGRAGGFQAVTFSPDSKFLAAGAEDGFIRLWESATGKERKKWKGHDDAVSSLQFAADGTLASGDQGEAATLRLWEVPGGKLLHTVASPVKKLGFGSLAFTPDGKTLAFTVGSASHGQTNNGSVRLWDVAQRKELRTLPVPAPWRVAFAADEKTLAIGMVGGGELWDATTGEQLHRLGTYNFRDLEVAFSSNGRVLATGGWTRAIHFWDTATGKEILPVEGHQGQLNSLAIAPDGKTVLSGSWDCTARLWDAGSGKILRQWTRAHIINAVAFAPDGKTLAFAEHGGPIHVSGPASGDNVRRLEKSVRPVDSLAFAPDGKLLASGSAVWETDTGRRIREFESDYQWVAFALGGKVIARADHNGYVSLTEAKTGKILPRFEKVENLGKVAFAPDGTQLAASTSGEISLFDLATARKKFSFEAQVTWLPPAWSVDGKMLAGGTHDSGEIILWETVTGKERWRLRGHQNRVEALAFSRDGRKLVSGGQDSTILIWDIAGTVFTGPGKVAMISAQELDRLWQDLASADAKLAFNALRRLATHADQTVRFLVERVKAVPVKVPEDIARLVNDLSSEQFAVREKANRSLVQRGDQPEPALVRSFSAMPNLETRRRMELLLTQLQAPTGERLRMLRAIEVLERIGDQPARGVFQTLAQGAAEALVTQQAQAALRRLGQTPQEPK